MRSAPVLEPPHYCPFFIKILHPVNTYICLIAIGTLKKGEEFSYFYKLILSNAQPDSNPLLCAKKICNNRHGIALHILKDNSRPAFFYKPVHYAGNLKICVNLRLDS